MVLKRVKLMMFPRGGTGDSKGQFDQYNHVIIFYPKLYFNSPELNITLSHCDLKQLIMYSMKTHVACVQVNTTKKIIK